MGYPKKFGSPWIRPSSLFSKIFNGLLFGWTLLYWPNLKFAAFPVPEIIGGTEKIWAVPGYANAPFSQKFQWAFVRMDPLNVLAKLKSVAFPIPEIIGGTRKKLGSPWIHPRSIFYKIFTGLLFGWTLYMHWPNLKFAAFPVPEIIGVPQKLGSPWIRPRSLFSKIFSWAFVRMDPVKGCYCSCQFEVHSSTCA